MYIKIGKKIQEYLNTEQISLSNFAERCDVTPQVLHKIIEGRKALNMGELQQIADGLMVPLNELFVDDASDTMASIIAKMENEHTQEELRFLEHVMEKMLKIEAIAKRGTSGNE